MALDASGNAASDTIAVVAGNPEACTRVQKRRAKHVHRYNTRARQCPGHCQWRLPDRRATTAGNCATAPASTVTLASNQLTLSANDSPPTGLTSATYVFDLGQQPVFSLYGVDTTTNTLVTYDLLQRSGTATLPISDDIVAIKALYGVDDGAATASIPGSGTLGDDIYFDEWVQPTGTGSIATIMATQASASQAFSQIKAIRLVVVARSSLQERSSDYSGGSTTLKLFQDLPAGVRPNTITTQLAVPLQDLRHHYSDPKRACYPTVLN